MTEETYDRLMDEFMDIVSRQFIMIKSEEVFSIFAAGDCTQEEHDKYIDTAFEKEYDAFLDTAMNNDFDIWLKYREVEEEWAEMLDEEEKVVS